MLQWTDFNFSRVVFPLVSCCAISCVHCTRILTSIARSLHIMSGTPEVGNGLICMCMNFKLLYSCDISVVTGVCNAWKQMKAMISVVTSKNVWLSDSSEGEYSVEIQQWLLQKSNPLSLLLISTSSLAAVLVSHIINWDWLKSSPAKIKKLSSFSWIHFTALFITELHRCLCCHGIGM